MRRRVAGIVAVVLGAAPIVGCGSDNATGPAGSGGGQPPTADRTAPTVSVNSPSNAAQLPAAGTIVVQGVAGDDVGVSEVRVAVNGAPAVAAAGTTSWTFTIPVTASGSYTVSAVAVDGAGNTSTPASVTFAMLPGWLELGQLPSTWTEVSIASDNQGLVATGCAGGSSGSVQELTPSGWALAGSPFSFCGMPVVAMEGGVWLAARVDVGQNVSVSSNRSPVGVRRSGLRKQWGINVGFAQGEGYVSYTSRNSGSTLTQFLMLHYHPAVGSGPIQRLDGGWGRQTLLDHGLETAVTGDSTGLYVAFTQGGNLYVNHGAFVTGTGIPPRLGGSLTPGGAPQGFDLVLYQGQPVIAWIENGGPSATVARWDGAQWIPIGAVQVTTGMIGRIQLAVHGQDLYALTVYSDPARGVTVDRYDGTSWSPVSGVLDPGDVPSFTTGDITVYQDQPVVIYVASRVKVKRLLP